MFFLLSAGCGRRSILPQNTPSVTLSQSAKENFPGSGISEYKELKGAKEITFARYPGFLTYYVVPIELSSVTGKTKIYQITNGTLKTSHSGLISSTASSSYSIPAIENPRLIKRRISFSGIEPKTIFAPI